MRRFTFAALVAVAFFMMTDVGNAQTAKRSLSNHPYASMIAQAPMPDGVTSLTQPIEANVEQMTLVTIQNVRPVRVGRSFRGAGGVCAMGWRGMAIAFGERQRDGSYYVLYDPKPGRPADGECAAATVAFVDKAIFGKLKTGDNRVVAARAQLRQ
jgi:hypothetical protein